MYLICKLNNQFQTERLTIQSQIEKYLDYGELIVFHSEVSTHENKNCATRLKSSITKRFFKRFIQNLVSFTAC